MDELQLLHSMKAFGVVLSDAAALLGLLGHLLKGMLLEVVSIYHHEDAEWVVPGHMEMQEVVKRVLMVCCM